MVLSELPLSAPVEHRPVAAAKECRRTLISTWLNVLPLYTPMTLPIISGTMTMSRR